jgi:hypothetical protein
MTRSALAAVLMLGCTTGCYHFRFEQQTPPPPPEARLVTYEERVPTYLNGFIGTGIVDTTRYCARPVRTELRVSALDVLLSVGTLLIYTPHTLSVTCAARETSPAQP